MTRRNAVKGILWAFTGMAVVVAASRFSRGLGATTNLTDSTPWGFWIAFDVMAGVALAAGGFVMAAVVYIFRIEKYHDFARPAVLTAFLGYLAVAIGLTFDLGVPWNIWHPMIYWQYHSVLFEVAMCVMIYLTVLALEFTPVALEHKLARIPILQSIYKVLKALTIPLVIVGIMLSTLHQSSLGSLFVIMPYRVNPLWYSPGMMLPYSFFISAIALGFMMVTLEHYVSAWVYKHEPRTDLLARLDVAAGVALALYLAVRVGDLTHRGILPGALDGSWQSWLFVAELGISAVIPMIILFTPRLRRSGKWLFTAAAMVVAGMVLYRLDIAIITMKRWPGTSYFPSAVELMVSLGIVSGLALVFMYFVENLEVFHETMKQGVPRRLETAEETLANLKEGQRPPRGVVTGTVAQLADKWFINEELFQRPRFWPTTRVWLGTPLRDAVRRYSMIVIVAMALTAAVLPNKAIFGYDPGNVPVTIARPVAGTAGDVLKIDGNLSGDSVTFNHKKHAADMGGDKACVECHHMNAKGAMGTTCASCHTDMYSPASAFDHQRHQDLFHGNRGCIECHPLDKDPKNAKSCVACHQQMFPGKAENEKVKFMAPSYQDAMHGKCEPCHQRKAAKQGKPELGRCSECHRDERN
ncbi:MAG TPA: Ni/Fe-hydrogenase cytochrome b subunit [bacterium]|nr:Ni/Fe-hydrogenase cytochrome b subunit [bacterium]